VLRYDPPVWMAMAFFACKIPKTIAEVTPLAVLLATLFTLAAMLKSHELIAMRASGVSQYAISVPFLASAFVVSVLSIGFNETIVPWAMRQRVEIKRVHFHKQSLFEWRTAWRVGLWSSWKSGRRLVYAAVVDGGTGKLKNVAVVEFKGLKPVARLDAVSVNPVKGAWEMEDVQVYRWRSDGLQLHRHRLAVYPVQASFEDFMRDQKPVDAQSLTDLSRSIDRLKKTGRKYAREQVFYYLKWAYPFASCIVALLGLGVSFSFQTNPREGQAAAVVVAIVAAVGYISLAQLGRVLGIGGVLPPLVAMWMANIVFLIVGLVLLWRAWKF